MLAVWRNLVADLQIPSHRIRHVEALQRAGHVGPRLSRAFLGGVADVAFLQLLANPLGIPVRNAEADVTDRRGHAVRGLLDRRRGRRIIPREGTRLRVTADDRAADAADLHRHLRAVAGAHVPTSSA